MEPIRITAEMTAGEMADAIFYKFEINQSCLIKGFVMDGEQLFPKGDVVLEMLERIDSKQNMMENGQASGMRRKRKKLPDSIGGYVAHKIFRFKKETIDREYRVTIWRVQ